MAKKNSRSRKSKKSRKSGGRKMGKHWIWLGAMAALIILTAMMSALKGRVTAPKDISANVILSFKGDSQACGAFQAWDVTQVVDKWIALSDQGRSRILVFGLDGKFSKEIKQDKDDKPEFKEISGLSFDPQGNIYVMDAWNGMVRGFDLEGKSGIKAPVPSSYGPRGVAWSNGDFVVADTGTQRVVRISATGTQLAVYGRRGTGKGEFTDPVELELDSKGNIYVVDAGNNRVVELDSNGKFVKNFEAQAPVSGVAVDSKGRVYLSSLDGGFVKVFENSGKLIGRLVRSDAKGEPLRGVKGLSVTSDGRIIASLQDQIMVLQPILGSAGI